MPPISKTIPIWPTNVIVLPEKNVIDLFTYKRAKPQKFAINTVQDRFQKITFARVLRIEQFQQLQHELLIDDAFTDGRLKVRTLQEPESYKVPHQVPANINRKKKTKKLP